MPEKTTENEELGRFTAEERVILREMLENYTHSRWLFLFTMKIAKWLAIIVGGIVAYKQLPGILK